MARQRMGAQRLSWASQANCNVVPPSLCIEDAQTPKSSSLALPSLVCLWNKQTHLNPCQSFIESGFNATSCSIR